MNNPCLFKYIAVISLSVFPVFVLFFAVNKTPKVNVVVVNIRHGHGLMSTDRPLFYEKKNEADDHGISKGKIILIIISA